MPKLGFIVGAFGAEAEAECSAGRAAVRIELAVGADDARLGRGQLAADVHHVADRAQRPAAVRCGAHDVDAQLGGGVALVGLQRRVHRAAQRRIEQGGIPAAMHRAQRVVVHQLRHALEHGPALLDLHQPVVQRVHDVRVGQLAGQHGLHDLQPALAPHLVGTGHAGCGAGGPGPLLHRLEFLDPGRLGVFCVHRRSLQLQVQQL
jgi:hypothetical protein